MRGPPQELVVAAPAEAVLRPDRLSEQWGGVRVSIGEPLVRHRDALTAAGWDVQVLPGLDHLAAMHSSVVLPILSTWLRKAAWWGTRNMLPYGLDRGMSYPLAMMGLWGKRRWLRHLRTSMPLLLCSMPRWMSVVRSRSRTLIRSPDWLMGAWTFLPGRGWWRPGSLG
jgi:hypothetical protein